MSPGTATDVNVEVLAISRDHLFMEIAALNTLVT
jgi:hypothetical protein